MDVSRVQWDDARRIISTRHPPVDLFEDIADPRDWELLISLEMKTNGRVMQNVGRLNLVPPERRVAGPGASYVMAPFVYVSEDWSGRFHDGTFGAYYAAESFETALEETRHHRAEIYRAAGDAPGWFSQFRELIGSVDSAFHDLRVAAEHDVILNPDDYGASQRLARELRGDGSNGIVFPSVRRPGGECVAAFWPDVIGVPRTGRVLSYHFDGERIDYVRDETNNQILEF